jgi:hypothetical protein
MFLLKPGLYLTLAGGHEVFSSSLEFPAAQKFYFPTRICENKSNFR